MSLGNALNVVPPFLPGKRITDSCSLFAAFVQFIYIDWRKEHKLACMSQIEGSSSNEDKKYFEKTELVCIKLENDGYHILRNVISVEIC